MDGVYMFTYDAYSVYDQEKQVDVMKSSQKLAMWTNGNMSMQRQLPTQSLRAAGVPILVSLAIDRLVFVVVVCINVVYYWIP